MGRKGFQIVKTAQKFKEIKADPQLNTLGPLMTLMVGRLMELVERTDTLDSPERMKRIAEAWKDLKINVPGLFKFIKDDKDANKAYNILDHEIMGAHHDYESWNQIVKFVDEIRKLNETQMKVLRDMKALMSAEDVFELAGLLLAAISNVINDPTTLERISAEFASILGDEYTGGVDQGSGEIIDIQPGSLDRGQVLHTGDTGSPDLSGEDIPATVPKSSPGGSIQQES